MYTSQLTYPVYDLNSTEFMEVVREVLQVEMLNQKNNHGKSFLPEKVNPDRYLLNGIADTEMNPSYCAIAKAKMNGTEDNFSIQQNNNNIYIISILAYGLSDLRKIADSIYVILNDSDVRIYLNEVESVRGDKLVFRKSAMRISSLSTEIEEKKTKDNKDAIYGNLIFEAQIVERTQLNTSTPIDSVYVDTRFGEDEKKIEQVTELNT